MFYVILHKLSSQVFKGSSIKKKMSLVNISDLLHFQNVLLIFLNIYPLYLEVAPRRFMQRFLYSPSGLLSYHISKRMKN